MADLDKLKEFATRSHPKDANMICALLVCEGGDEYWGFTVRRSTVIGSTCAERMVLDGWYQNLEHSRPVKLILIGKIMRSGWTDAHICYPCGTCREMYHQFAFDEGIRQFRFECYSWDKKETDVKTIKELLYYGEPFYQ